MTNRQPSTERFDALCRHLDEYDALPELQAPAPADTTEWQADEHPDEALDDQILAGLVTPS